ncbi:MAG: radical SAM family heme chaperone HemW [bacterium]|nr:radical SAM family heme chaperone HemW [bacterium]MCM1375976.1 radical SAM family heme chaperone HemW [Muribaculum sp.]
MKRRNLEIYIHVPFCVQKCGYCDFLSAPAGGDIRERYVQALACEIEGRAAQCGEYEVSTVYFGGGTPSLLTPEQMARLLKVLKGHYLVSPAAEITMEANPGTVDGDSLTLYRRAGVNRLSLGLQSSWDEELKVLGRIHTWQQFLEAYEAAGEAGFTHVNVDLMCGLPGQTLTSYETTLRRVAELIPEPEHISAYSLILEEGTAFIRRYEAGELKLPDEETERELYGLTEQVLGEYGYRRYEISNYAKAGCECRHNVGYWTRENYLGFGIGAASLMENRRFQNGEDLQVYLENPLGQRQQEHQLSVAEQMEEYMFLGLRLTKGVEAGLFERTFHCALEQVYGEVIRRHVAQGLLAFREGASGRFLHLTPRGLDLANYVMADFLDPLV